MRPRTGSEGFTFIELLFVVAVILILSAVAIPNLWQARIAANEAAAAASVRAIQTAETVYAASYGGTYSAELSQLGPPPVGTKANQGSADMVDGLLASGTKGGYQFIYIPGPINDGKINSYLVEAVPTDPCLTGSTSFTVDSSIGITVSPQSFPSATQGDPVTQTLGGELGGSPTCGGD